MLSVNRKGQEDLIVTKLSKIRQYFLELWIFEVLVNPYYRHLQVGNSARICDVIVDNSPLVMYLDFHKMSFLQTVRGAIIPILSKMMQKLCSNDILNKYTTAWKYYFLMKMRGKKVKLSVHNQWRVVHNDILAELPT